jgi:hypothetical protein
MKYKIGQKVVYIGEDLRGHWYWGRFSLPVPQKIYTIRGGRVMPPGYGNIIGYLFEEISNPLLLDVWAGGEEIEMHTREEWIRPLQERKNDGEAFVAGLRPLLNMRRVRAFNFDEADNGR